MQKQVIFKEKQNPAVLAGFLAEDFCNGIMEELQEDDITSVEIGYKIHILNNRLLTLLDSFDESDKTTFTKIRMQCIGEFLSQLHIEMSFGELKAKDIPFLIEVIENEIEPSKWLDNFKISLILYGLEIVQKRPELN